MASRSEPPITALGGLIATLALFQSSFWLFAAGLMVIGLGGAFVQQFRFAAADNAPPEFKARAISFVLAGGVFTAVIGPQIVIFTRDLLAPVMFAGAFAAILGLAAVGAVLLSFLRVRQKASSHDEHAGEPARELSEIARQPQFAIGLLCAVGSYALMSFVMTGAPLAMVGCGFSPDEAAIGISWHVMAMFGPSFFTGALISRFGKETIVATGLILLIACADRGAVRHPALAVLDGADPARPRLEFRLHRRDRDGRRQLPEFGEGQGPGPARFHPVRQRGVRLADVGRGLQRLGLGHAELDRVPGDGGLSGRTCWTGYFGQAQGRRQPELI